MRTFGCPGGFPECFGRLRRIFQSKPGFDARAPKAPLEPGPKLLWTRGPLRRPLRTKGLRRP